MPWYTLQTHPNYEAKVIEGIVNRRQEKNLQQIREIFSPEELVVEYKDGKKKERKKRLYNTYIFLEMDYTDELLHELKKIRGVVGFVGNKSKPAATPQKDIDIMKAQVSSDTPKHKITFELNSRVRINTGSFADFIGVIKSVDYEKNKAEVTLTIFSRESNVDFPLSDLEPVKD